MRFSSSLLHQKTKLFKGIGSIEKLCSLIAANAVTGRARGLPFKNSIRIFDSSLPLNTSKDA